MTSSTSQYLIGHCLQDIVLTITDQRITQTRKLREDLEPFPIDLNQLLSKLILLNLLGKQEYTPVLLNDVGNSPHLPKLT